MSGYNAQKTPFVSSQNAFAARKAQDAIALTGKALPCSIVAIPTPGVPIVTVKFEVQDPTFTTLPNITVPVLGSEYVRLPLQAPSGGNSGTKGVVTTIDAYLGGISGLGGGVADLSQRGNLSTLIFAPVGNKAWVAVDPQAVTVYAPNGVALRDSQSKVTFTLTPIGIAIVGNVTLKGNLSVTGNVTITGGLTATADVVAGGISLMHHVHSASGGTGTGGPPVPGS
jgi:hypothetical protein